jgi:acetyl esterase/lipase
MNTIKKISSVLLLVCIYNMSFAQRFLNEVFTDAQITTTNNVVFSTNYNFLSDPENGVLGNQTMKVYQPDQSVDNLSKRPVIIFLHTGNFLPPGVNGAPTGSNNDSSSIELCKQWAKRGFVAVAPAYRLGWNPLSTDAEVRRGTLLNAVYRALQDVKASVLFKKRCSIY